MLRLCSRIGAVAAGGRWAGARSSAACSPAPPHLPRSSARHPGRRSSSLHLAQREHWSKRALQLRDHDKPADPETGRPEGLPHLARMAHQWLGCPATSAGVERLFSKAGSMHHDLKGSMEDGSLEHSLIATANTE